MKRILAYTLVAVLLGVVTMLAPFALFISEMGTDQLDTSRMDTQPETFYSSENMQNAPSKTEQTQGIQPVTHPTDTVFIVFLSAFSFVVALGVTSYFKRKTLSSSLP